MRLAYIVVDDIAPDATELERLTSAGQKLMPGDGTFQVIPPGFGPTVYYESAVGAAPCVPALLHNVAERNGDCDAMLIGCFLDPACGRHGRSAMFPFTVAARPRCCCASFSHAVSAS
jgi:Asp/Glu/hydantoin racemase